MSRAAGLIDHARSLRMTMWGEPVTYYRTSTGAELSLTARRAAVFVAAGGDDTVVDSKHVDWCVIAADLLDRGARFTPHPGDKILAADKDGNSQTYLVGLAGNDEPWEPADSDGYELRIHTKLWNEA
jgi:hypothetical protein